jgi:HD-GYP domain-containing protein (c-di-GMP phosphodiesterase class II)
MENAYIPVRKSHLHYYRAIPLYYLNKDQTFGLYKPPGKALSEMRIEGGQLPSRLYIRHTDKLRSIHEVQRAFNRQLEDHIRTGDPESVKSILVNIVEETFSEPRSGSLEGLSETVNILVSDDARETGILQRILGLSQNDYTSALHSVNVMALAIGFAVHAHYSQSAKKILGLSALLHDIGKTRIDPEILCAPRKLTGEEFARIKTHPTIGYNILDTCRFPYAEIKLCALQHHEKEDGSGYPQGITRITPTAQVVGLIDCYEALTNDDRPYRTAMDPLKGLTIIKEDVVAGKFNRDIFEKFAYSLI